MTVTKSKGGDSSELLVPSDALVAIVGSGPLPRSQVTKIVWQYIKTNGLQDSRRKTRINPDHRLAAVLGPAPLTMFEMTKRLSTHLSHYLKAEPGEAPKPTQSMGKQTLTEATKSERLPASTLSKATPEHIFAAVQRLLSEDVQHAFGASTDYDLIADDGTRLPPKAVLGLALSAALGGEAIEPKHFTAGETSPCFKLLRKAGYQVVPKGQAAPSTTSDIDSDEDAEWTEGKRRLVSHVVGERKPGLVQAKKAQYRRQHGKLTCERCGLDPVALYGTLHGEACIEVHHATTQVREMRDGHKTTLADLQCLCANCHRLVHRAIRLGIPV